MIVPRNLRSSVRPSRNDTPLGCAIAPDPIHREDEPTRGSWMHVTGDSFPGVRFLSAESTRKIGAQCCLDCAVRSQGFSPSQRFSPFRALWLCFTPHPPLGFRSSEHFPLRQPRYLSISVALLSFRQRPDVSGCPVSSVCPFPPSPALPVFHVSSAEFPPCTSVLR